jgi:hypothetical protein
MGSFKAWDNDLSSELLYASFGSSRRSVKLDGAEQAVTTWSASGCAKLDGGVHTALGFLLYVFTNDHTFCPETHFQQQDPH